MPNTYKRARVLRYRDRLGHWSLQLRDPLTVVYIDIAGPDRRCKGFCNLLTWFIRFTWWPEATLPCNIWA